MLSSEPGWHAGASVKISGLAKAPQHNGKIGRISAKAAEQEGRIGVELGKGQVLAIRRENLELVLSKSKLAASSSPFAAPPSKSSEDVKFAVQALPQPPPRTGGEWDDLSEQQVQLSLSDEEHRRAGGGGSGSGQRTTLIAAVTYGVKHGQLKVFANPPRYDRLFIWTTKDEGRAKYVVEAGVDAWEGKGWWTTKNFGSEAEITSQGLVQIDAAALKSEYAGVFAFLELCKTLGAPRYTMKTDLDPDAKPHVLAVVERVLAACTLRFLLAEDALERADA